MQGTANDRRDGRGRRESDDLSPARLEAAIIDLHRDFYEFRDTVTKFMDRMPIEYVERTEHEKSTSNTKQNLLILAAVMSPFITLLVNFTHHA